MRAEDHRPGWRKKISRSSAIVGTLAIAMGLAACGGNSTIEGRANALATDTAPRAITPSGTPRPTTTTATSAAPVIPTDTPGVPAPGAEPVERTTAPAPDTTRAQSNAVRAARDYLGIMAFSRSGLIDQLEFDGYSAADATAAVDQISPDWNAQAAAAAEEYLDIMPLSRSELIDQLEFDGFTSAQATYGADQAGL